MRSERSRSRGAARWLLVVLVAAFPIGIGAGALLARRGTDVDASPEIAASRSTTATPERGLRLASDALLRRTTSGSENADRPVPPQAQAAPAAGAAASLPEGSLRFTPIVSAARRVAPSVVSVTVLRRVRTTRRDLFDLFVPRGYERTVRALGSGFAIDSAGFVLTNHHVVADADSIVVTDVSGHIFQASLVGSDELTDIAVLRIEPRRVPPAPLGTSSDLMVGEPTVAIGNPFGYLLANTEATVTSGVISGVGRDIRSDERRDVLYAGMVQTDAAINPGNSGGPLVNADGEVIGINSSIFSKSGGSEGLGFAIPIDRAVRIASELRKFGRIRRPWVGIDLVSVDSDTLRGEAVVRRVAPNSPAERAGLREGDVVRSLDGQHVSSPIDWQVGLLDAGVHSRVTVHYTRAGHARAATMPVEELPSERAERVEVLSGLQLITVTPQIAIERKLDVESGAMIADISAAAAGATGLRTGDVIVAINRREVRSARDAADLFHYYAGRGGIVVVFQRGGATAYTSFSVR